MMGAAARLACTCCGAVALAGCLPDAADEPGRQPVQSVSGQDIPAAAGAPPIASAAPPVAADAPTPPASDPSLPPPAFDVAGEFIQGGFLSGTAPVGTVTARLGETELDLADDNTFFAAFDRDSPARMTLTAQLENGQTVRHHLAIAPREWSIQHVDIARRSGGPSAAFMRRRTPELEAIYEARARRTGASGWRQDFIWPVTGRISGLFGRQRVYRGEPGSYHSGIDIAPGAGVTFVAPANGVVVLARKGFSLEGGLIIVDHGMGLNSAFLHAASIAVEEGQAVRQGDRLGTVGATGRATGPHLHWSLKWKDARLDPLLLAGPMD